MYIDLQIWRVHTQIVDQLLEDWASTLVFCICVWNHTVTLLRPGKVFFLCHGCQILSCRVWGSPQWRTCTRYCTITIDNAHARNSLWWRYWEDTSKDYPSKACSQHVLNVAFLMPFGPCAKVLAAAMQASPSNRVWMPNWVKHSGCASLDPVQRTSWVQCIQPSTMLPCLRFDAQFWTPSICKVVQNWSII